MPPSFRRSFISIVAVLALGAPVVAAPTALAGKTAKASHLGDRTLRAGASGADVRELQQALGQAGFKVKTDGKFGTGTLRAVKRFQRASRLQPSGTVGTKTVKALRRALRGSSANANGGFSDDPEQDGAHHSLGDRIPVKKGMSGHDIRVLQDFLTRAGYKVGVDGEFGSTTEKAVKKFETAQSRAVDGVMDAGDIDALRTLAGPWRRRPDRPRRPRHRSRQRARPGQGDHRRGQPDRQQALQVRRRPRQVERLRLRLLGLGLLRPARRGAARQPAAVRRLRELGRLGPRPVGDRLREGQPRLHGGRRHPLRHERAHQEQHALAGRHALVQRVRRPPPGRALIKLHGPSGSLQVQ